MFHEVLACLVAGLVCLIGRWASMFDRVLG